MSTKVPDFQMGVDTRLIYDRIVEEKGNYGKLITYEELSRLVGRNVQHEAAGCLRTARAAVLRDHNIGVATIKSVGIKIETEAEKVQHGLRSVRKIQGEAKRGGRHIAAADYEQLSMSDKAAHNAGLSMLGAIGALSTRKAVKKLESRVGEASKPLPLAETLRHFGA